MRRLLPGNAVQDPPDLRNGFRRGSGILDLLIVPCSEVLFQVSLADADAAADTDGAQLARLNVAPDRDGMHPQPFRHVVDGQETLVVRFGCHRMLVIA